MSTLKLEHISNISSSGNDLSIDTNGRLGIGTESPVEKLHVLGNIRVNNNQEFRTVDTGNNPRTIMRVNSSDELEYGWSGAGPVKFMGGGSYTERMRIHTDGNVGIGTDTPTEKFVIHGDGARMTISSNDHEVAMLGRRGSSGAALDRGYLRLRKDGVTNDGVVIDTDGSSWFNGGSIGIGTTNPESNLHVQTAAVSGKHLDSLTDLLVEGTDTRLQVMATDGGSNGSAMILSTADHHWIHHAHATSASNTYSLGYYNSTASGFDSANLSSEILNITTGGNVGIGTTNPGSKLEVNGGSTTGTHAQIVTTGSGHNFDMTDGTSTARMRNISGRLHITADVNNEAADSEIRLLVDNDNKFSVLSSGYLAAQSAAQVRLVLGNAGNPLDNTSNWIRGNQNYLQFNNAGSGYTWETTGTEKMRLTSDGKLGIGTNGPGSTLDVYHESSGGGTDVATLLNLRQNFSDIVQQRTAIDFTFTDNNTNEIPQARIAAQTGPNANADSQLKEGHGALIFYTNKATTDGPTPTGLTAHMKIDYNGHISMYSQPVGLWYNVTNNSAVAQSELVAFDSSSSMNRGIADSNSRSRFTVPADGIYAVNFTVGGSVITANAGDGIRIVVDKNGSVWTGTADTYNIESTGSAAGQEWTFTEFILVDMLANQYIELRFDNVGSTAFNASFGNLNMWKLA